MPWICSSGMAQFSMQPACACLPGTAASCMCLNPRRHHFLESWVAFCVCLAVYNHKHLDNQIYVQYPGKSGFTINHSRNQGLPGWAAIIPTWAFPRIWFLPASKARKPPSTQHSPGQGHSLPVAPLPVTLTSNFCLHQHNVKHHSSSSGGRWVC